MGRAWLCCQARQFGAKFAGGVWDEVSEILYRFAHSANLMKHDSLFRTEVYWLIIACTRDDDALSRWTGYNMLPVVNVEGKLELFIRCMILFIGTYVMESKINCLCYQSEYVSSETS